MLSHVESKLDTVHGSLPDPPKRQATLPRVSGRLFSWETISVESNSSDLGWPVVLDIESMFAQAGIV